MANQSLTTRPVTPLLSCVLPVYNEASNIAAFIKELSHTLTEVGVEFELIAIDDGSKDDSVAIMQGLLNDYPLTVYQFSRNFGKEAAMTAGLAQAKGDVVLLIDSDFQHPISLIPTMLTLWQSGYDMVYGVRNRNTEPKLKIRLTQLYYWLLKLGSAVDIPVDAGDFRLMDKKVVTALNGLPERNRYMKGLYAWVGFSSIGIEFDELPRRAGKTNFNFFALLKLAVAGITAFSDVPLKICMVVGFIIALLSTCYGVCITFDTLMYGIHTPGWATLAAGLAFLGGIQLIFIGVLGEYIARIYNEVKGRPNYIIGQTLSAVNPTDKTATKIATKLSSTSSDSQQPQ